MKDWISRLRNQFTGPRLKKNLKKMLQFIANPRLLLCFAIGWMITNGWSYVLFGLGTYYEIDWMVAVAGAYLAFLWLPISPEKLVTCAIALALLRWLFPQDEKTLAVVRGWYEKGKAALKNRRDRKAEQKAQETAEENEPT